MYGKPSFKKKIRIQNIAFKDIDKTNGSLRRISALIQSFLPKGITFSNDPYLIVYQSLEVFAFTKGKYSFEDRDSVERQCLIILERFGIYERGQIVDVFCKKVGDIIHDPILDFTREIVGFKDLPGSILPVLENQVKGNLKGLLELIEKYESNPIIINYKQAIRRPEHKSKVVIDFYNRCLIERDFIVKYLTNDLERRAVVKATQDERFRGVGLMWFEDYWDRPYRWWQFRSIEYFDYEKINVCRHRLGEVSVKEIPQLESMYYKNKKLFYRRLKGFLSPEEVFIQMKNFYIPILPKVIERRPVIEELEKLMKSRSWYGFTALALTQVEGVFSDMLHILQPQQNYSSLSTKVLAVRPHYGYDERNLDYFEYHLPFLRNSFLHSGTIKDKDFRLLSFDLLYDLHYLLQVFHEIDDPHMELHKMLIKNSTEIINGLESLMYIFALVKAIRERFKKNPTHKELANTLTDWDRFQREIFLPSAELEFYINIEIRDINEKIEDFFERVKVQSFYGNESLDISKAQPSYLQEHITLIIETFSERLESFKEEYRNLMMKYDFMRTYRLFLTDAPKEVNEFILDIQQKQKVNFSKLVVLKPLFMNLKDFNER